MIPNRDLLAHAVQSKKESRTKEFVITELERMNKWYLSVAYSFSESIRASQSVKKRTNLVQTFFDKEVPKIKT